MNKPSKPAQPSPAPPQIDTGMSIMPSVGAFLPRPPAPPQSAPEPKSNIGPHVAGYLGTAALCLVLGFFAGREYHKWEIRSTFATAVKGYTGEMAPATEKKPGATGQRLI